MVGKMKFVLCYLARRQDGKIEILLSRKKWREGSKNIGVGRYNGYGGIIEAGETERQAIVREIKEESGPDNSGVIVSTLPEDMQKIAVTTFRNINPDGTTFEAEVHDFLCWKWEGKPRESEEKEAPEWHPIGALPFSDMMPSDPYWLLKALGGWKLRAYATLEKNQTVLVDSVGIQYVGELPEDQEVA